MESAMFLLFLLVPNVCFAQYDINTVYMLLSDKIDAVNMEVRFLRTQLQTTQEELEVTKTELKDVQQTIAALNVNTTIQTRKGTSSKKTTTKQMSHWSRNALTRVTKALQAEKAVLRETTTLLREELDLVKDNYTETTKLLRTELDLVKDNCSETSKTITERMEMEATDHSTTISGLNTRLDQSTDNIKSLTISITDLKTDQEANTLQMATNSQKLDALDASMITWNKRLDTQQNGISARIDTAIELQERCQSGARLGLAFTREASFPVTSIHYFNPPFKRTPSLVFGPTVLDVSKFHNLRYNVYATDVTRTSFKIHVHTWSDTILYSLRLSWMACPT